MWYLLATSLLLLEFNRKLSVAVLALTVSIGVYNHALDWRAVVFMIVLVAIAGTYASSENLKVRRLLEISLLLLSFGLMLHLIPGFHNLKILNGVRMGAESAPFSMYYNFDKALVPFLLIICLKSLFNTPPPLPGKFIFWIVLIFAVPALLMTAVVLGGLKVEFHQPEWLFEFLLANVFFVSLAEETLFRGYLQQRLSSVMHPLTALIITSLLFGGLHYPGGILMVIFATLAGLIYGLAWMWSGRVWVAVVFHVGLNLCHLQFFTYPVLRHVQ